MTAAVKRLNATSGNLSIEYMGYLFQEACFWMSVIAEFMIKEKQKDNSMIEEGTLKLLRTLKRLRLFASDKTVTSPTFMMPFQYWFGGRYELVNLLLQSHQIANIACNDLPRLCCSSEWFHDWWKDGWSSWTSSPSWQSNVTSGIYIGFVWITNNVLTGMIPSFVPLQALIQRLHPLSV